MANLSQLGFWPKVALTVGANFIIALSMAVMHYANVGADPITVLIGGIAVFFRLPEGTAAFVLSCIFFTITLLFNRAQIKAATILSVVTLGPFMEAGLWLCTQFVPKTLPFLVRVAATGLSSAVMGLAIGFYLSLRFGASPTDSIMLLFHKVLGWNYQYCTWTFYTISLLIGVLLGGVCGVGTFLSLALVGCCCNATMRKLGAQQAKA